MWRFMSLFALAAALSAVVSCGSRDPSGDGDTAPPVISDGQPTGTLPAGTTQVTMRVTTDEDATCRWGTALGDAYTDLPNTFATTGGVAHSTLITGLSNDQSYTYYVRCQDSSDNANDVSYAVAFAVAAANEVDNTPPSQVTGLTANAQTPSVGLTWTPATDDVAVVGYRIYRDGTAIATTADTSHTDGGLSADTQYTYAVAAYDAADNEGARSSSVIVTTNTFKGCEAALGSSCHHISLSGLDSNPGTASLPVATWAAAEALATAGDYIYYHGGVYSAGNTLVDYQKQLNGAAGERIVIKPYPGEVVVFDGQGTSGSLACLNGEGAVLEGFEIRGSDATGPENSGAPNCWTLGVGIWGEHHEVRNNYLHDIVGDASGNGGSMRVQGGRFASIHHNTFKDLRNPGLGGSNANIAHLILFGGGDFDVHHNWFEITEQQGQSCFRQKHDALVGHSEVYSNTFVDCPTGVIVDGGLYSVHHNLLLNSLLLLGLDTGGHDNVFEYNTLVSNEQSLIAGTGHSLTLTNNILYQTATIYDAGNGRYTMRINHYGSDYAAHTGSFTINDNCYYNPNLAVKFSWWGAGGGAIYTLPEFRAAEGYDLDSVEQGPQLVDIAGMDFVVQNSACQPMGAYAGANPGDPPLIAWH